MNETFIFPTSYAQQRLWFINQLEPENISYNIFETRTFATSLDVEALECSLNEIARRHESLRTTFSAVDGRAVQRICSAEIRPLPVVDLSQLTMPERQAELERLSNKDALTPFDLESGPLWRARLVRLDDMEHVLLLTMHHIISDGLSMNVLWRELEVLYEAYAQGTESPLPELAIQYADYAVWQRDWLQGDELERQMSYWRERLKDMPEMLELPTDRVRPSVLSPAGASQWLSISKSLTDQLRELSRNNGVTLFMTLLAAFKALLYGYTGREDIVIGLPIANRSREELESLIGFFTNTLVLRTDLSGNPTFHELLLRVRDTCLGAYEHQDLPFEKLVEELQPERSLSHNMLVQVMFQLITPISVGQDDDRYGEKSGRESDDEAGPEEEMYVESGTAISDIGVDLLDMSEGISGRVEYSTDLFEHTTIRRIIGHLKTLLKNIVAYPEARLSELSLMTEAEQRQLLIEKNSTHRDYPMSRSIQQLFESQVERTPQAIATDFEGAKLSYHELNIRANQLAHYLRRHGIGPEVPVGILDYQSTEAIVGILGILKAGGVHVALDADYPQQRLSFLLRDSRVRMLLTKKHLVERSPLPEMPVVCLDADQALWSEEPIDNPVNNTEPENLALIIYTSGSTGQPKGVMLTHRGLCNRLQWGQEESQFTTGDRFLQNFSYCFDFSTWEIFSALIAGARLVIARPGGNQDASYLVKLIADEKVTIAGCTPAMLDLLLEEPELKRCDSLKTVFCGGEPLPVELQQRFFGRLDAALQNTYGPTEASIDVTNWICANDPELRTVPIGRPIANTQIYLLDRHLHPTPVGVAGELYIGGASLARGYLGKPDLTAEKFIPDPYNDEPGSRLYQTGDLARYRTDGAIEFLGRRDHQVKLRGFRVETGEIEEVLSQHPSVRAAVVQAREDTARGKHLVAYLVVEHINGSARELPFELRRFLEDRLPKYMIPAAFVLLDNLPRLSNGKVNLSALPAPADQDESATSAFVTPQTEMEQTIAGIWQEVFGLKQVSIQSNFFELGGHSLTLVRVHSKLRGILNQEIPMIDLFRHPTISSLARSLSGEQSESTRPQRIQERADKQRMAASRHREAKDRRAKAHG